jgi:hypothetical protein
MRPATYDFAVVRGAAGPTQGLVIRLKTKDENGDLFNIPFDDVRLSISRGDVLIARHSIANGRLVVSDIVEAEIAWRPTPEETRAIPTGSRARYEVEVRNGTSESIYMVGTLTGIGGINDDDGDSE